MNKKIITGIIVFVVVIGVAITLALTVGNSNDGVEKENAGNVGGNENSIEQDISTINEIIKVESSGDGYETYLLDAQGKVYVTGKSIADNFVELTLETEYKVVDIASTFSGLLFKLENGEFYLISYDIKSDKEIKTSLKKGSAKRIMLDNIVSYTTDSISKDNTYKFLTKTGELYELVYNAYNESSSNVRKVMDNVKCVESNWDNVAIIDKENNAYVYGYNVSENGILGKSDYAPYFDTKIHVSKPVKIAENVKQIEVASRTAMHNLVIYYVNTNNELYVIGQIANNGYFMGEINNFLDKPLKLYENVKQIHAMMNQVIVETMDGKLVKIETHVYAGKETLITDNYKSVTITRSGFGGMFILTENNELYGYGSNDLGKFGVGEYEFNKQYELFKIKDNVKKVFLSKDYNGVSSFIVTTDGILYAAGGNSNGALGIPNKEKVYVFEQINY